MRKILCIVGARPNFMKIGPILTALADHGFAAPLVHTGQHYDEAMSDSFFASLGLPRPAVNLEVGGGSLTRQTAEIMSRFEPVLNEADPAAVLVVGDVTSTVACAMVAAHHRVPVIHVEAGLRSYDRTMPEEVNRVLTDQLSSFLFTTEETAAGNLQKEGIDPARVFFVGNVMIDTLLANVQRAIPAADTLGGLAQGYALVTLHRPSNVDDPLALVGLVDCLAKMGETVPVVFPLHPRTRQRLEAGNLLGRLTGPNFHLLPPQGYLEMLGLMRSARLVVTDSGGLQEETTALGIPCLTVRDNTERPVTISQGTNILVGVEPAAVMAAFRDVVSGAGKTGRIPKFWDGKAASRIAAILAKRL